MWFGAATRRTAVLTLVGVLLPLFVCDGQEGALSEGQKALDRNDPAAAEPLLRKAVEEAPADYTAHFNLAFALAALNKDSEAISELRKTLELQPGLYEADLNLGMLLLRGQRFEEAVPVLREASEKKASDDRPKDERAKLYYGQALLGAGRAEEAQRVFEGVVEANPKSAEAELGLGRALLGLKQFGESEKHVRTAALLDPSLRTALLEVAAAYEKADQGSEAKAIYGEFPGDPAAIAGIVRLAEKAGGAADTAALEQVVRAAPTVPNRLALATAWKASGNLLKAIEQLQLAVVTEPAAYDLRIYLGQMLRDQHQYAPAAQQFLAATRIRPDSAPAWNELAVASILSENYDAGLAALDRVKALGKEVPGDLYFRAITLDKLKQKRAAVEAYREFLAANGGKQTDQEFLARQRIRIIELELKGK